ncbi:MAG TPA: lactate utilization protein [Peptococcaceae bacterium]|nr:lactate utilization protein [Peptococcaceae bacterium]
MNDLKKWHRQTIGQRVVQELQKNNFAAVYFEERADALQYIMANIPEGATIGIGGSATLREIGLVSLLKEKGFVLYDHNEPGLTPIEKTEMRYKEQTADVFISSTNAITLSGELVNRDSTGNRVAAMMFGPKTVIVVAGINKVVRDLAEADERIKLYAAPINTKRHELPNPCLKTGQCADCRSAQRICNITTVIHRRPPLTNMHVVLIGEYLGF